MAITKYKVSQSGPVTMPACESTDRDFRMGFFAAWSIEASLTEFLGCSAVGLRAAAGSRYARTFGVERGARWLAGSKAYQATRTAVSL